MVNHGPSYVVAAVASIGGLLFGYDIGVMSSVLVMDRFVEYFGDLSSLTTGIVVSFLTLGCFIGSLAAGQLCDRISRKRTILIGACIFVIGSIVQGFSKNIEMLTAGRFINGLSVGLLSMSVPTYQSELSAPAIRGRLISLQQWAITWGIVIAFWIDVACNAHKTSNAQWRIPLFLQAVPAVILLVAMSFMPYSPRWLFNKNRDDEGLAVLAKLRSNGDESDPAVIEEMNEIKEAIRIEKEVTINSYSELFKYPIRRRLMLGVLIQIFQQLTGINVIMYYAPSIFKQAGIGGSNSAILAQGINGIINMLATIPAILFVDSWGRRKTIVIGSIGCGTAYFVMALTTAINATITTLENGDKDVSMNSKAGTYVVIVMVYVFVASFAVSWGPIGWIYPAEVFPMSMRAKGNSITTAANWLINFIVGLVAPILLKKLVWGLYLIFAICMYGAIAMVYFFFPETRGRTLEQMEVIFSGSIWAHRDAARVNQELSKSSTA